MAGNREVVDVRKAVLRDPATAHERHERVRGQRADTREREQREGGAGREK